MLAKRGWVRDSLRIWLWVVPGVGDTAEISVEEDETYTVRSVAPSGKLHTLRSIRGSDLVRILNIVEVQHLSKPAQAIAGPLTSTYGSGAALSLRIGPERWGPPVDAVSISAKYAGSCVSCITAIAIGDQITGSSRTGWACKSCVRVAGSYKQHPSWALPVGAPPIRLRFETPALAAERSSRQAHRSLLTWTVDTCVAPAWFAMTEPRSESLPKRSNVLRWASP